MKEALATCIFCNKYVMYKFTAPVASIIYRLFFFQWILPEMVAHGVITVLLLAHFQWIFFLLNTPLLGWLVYRWVYFLFSLYLTQVMHQSIPAVPIPPGQPQGICSRCQSRGLGISIPRGEPRAFDTSVFERWMTVKPLSRTELSFRD